MKRIGFCDHQKEEEERKEGDHEKRKQLRKKNKIENRIP